MGYFQISDSGTYTNEYAWNKVAHMLYLESPAGSGDSAGYSTCNKGGSQVPCAWDDVSQAEAYTKSLEAFFKAFPEYKSNSFYLSGESYFGQYGPNIAHWILTHNTTVPLKGIAAGNACWGGSETSVNCNGPNEEKNDVRLFYGKGLISKKLHDKVHEACGWSATGPDVARTESSEAAGLKCQALVLQVHEAVGPHNIYNLYDNCPGAAMDSSEEDAPSALELKHILRKRLLPESSQVEAEPMSVTSAPSDVSPSTPAPAPAVPGRVGAAAKTGGYTWSCGGIAKEMSST